MSTEDSNDQNGIDCTANEHISCEELKLRFELAKLDNVRLRRRMTRLEDLLNVKHGVETDWFKEQEDKVRERLQAAREKREGDSDE